MVSKAVMIGGSTAGVVLIALVILLIVVFSGGVPDNTTDMKSKYWANLNPLYNQIDEVDSETDLAKQRQYLENIIFYQLSAQLIKRFGNKLTVDSQKTIFGLEEVKSKSKTNIATCPANIFDNTTKKLLPNGTKTGVVAFEPPAKDSNAAVGILPMEAKLSSGTITFTLVDIKAYTTANPTYHVIGISKDSVKCDTVLTQIDKNTDAEQHLALALPTAATKVGYGVAWYTEDKKVYYRAVGEKKAELAKGSGDKLPDEFTKDANCYVIYVKAVTDKVTT